MEQMTERCSPYCDGWTHRAGCMALQAWDIPGSCTCGGRVRCRYCAAKKGARTRALAALQSQEEECSTCIQIRDKHNGFGPSHNGRASCESGSIASGGKHSHCACDLCF